MFSLDGFRDVFSKQFAVAAEERCDDATRAAVKNEAEMDRQRVKLDAVWNPYILLHRIDVPQQHVCKEEEEEQQICNQDWESGLDHEEPKPLQIKEEQEEKGIKQAETDKSALNLHIRIHTDVPQQHVCKEEEDEQQLCQQERKSSLDHEEPEPPKMKEEQEEELIKQEETDISTLNQHILTHTGTKLYTCGTCGRSFAKKCNLKDHLKIHTGEKPHPCTMCNKSFSAKGKLTGHMRTHTGEKPHSCSTCGKRYYNKSDMKRHMSLHTDTKQYTCGICEKSFRLKYSWQKHLKIHTGVKPYTCTICNKSFRQKGDLTIHMNRQTAGRSYSCRVCGKRFCQKSSMSTHICSHADASGTPVRHHSDIKVRRTDTQRSIQTVMCELPKHEVAPSQFSFLYLKPNLTLVIQDSSQETVLHPNNGAL